MTEPDLPFTPRAKRTLVIAARIADGYGHGYVGTEHLMMALLDDPEGIGGRTMHELGHAQAVRDAIVRIIESDGYSGKS